MSSLRPPAFLDLNNLEWRITARWQVWALVVVALASAGGLAWVAAYIHPLAAVALASAPLLLVAAGFAMPQRVLYPYIILGLALFVPLSLPTGRDSRLVMSLVFTIAAFAFVVLYVVAFRKPWPFLPSAINRPFIAWAIAVLISWFWGVAFRDVGLWIWPSFPFVQAASAVVMIMLPFALMLTAHFLTTERHLKILVGLFLIGGVLGLIPRFNLASLPVNIGGMFNMWVIALAGSLALFGTRFAPWQRLLFGLLAGLYLVWGTVLHVTWLAGWLPGVVALAVMIVNRSKFAAIFTGLLVVGVLLASLASVDQIIANENAESGSTRLAAWAINWSITKDHLLFGTGPAGYAAYYMTYLPSSAMATHSNYIDILSETGLVGTAAYMWLWATVLWVGFRVVHRLRGRGDFLQALANAAFAGAVACIVIMGFGDWLIPFAYTQTIMGFDYAVYNWIFVGTLLVVDRLTAPTARPASEPAAT
ncbi:MAG TPA: O-antigen ligase family protein [Anaerolineales bacterium]|nr:O-antigen ligase family protein [Anaerolineales bacterium]